MIEWEAWVDFLGVLLVIGIIGEVTAIYVSNKVLWTKMFLVSYIMLGLIRLLGSAGAEWVNDHTRQLAVANLVLVLIAMDLLRRAVFRLRHPD